MKQKFVLLASVAMGLVAALLTRFYLSAKDAEVAKMKQRFAERYGVMEVLCYAENVPGGAVLSKSMLGTKNVPAAGLRGQALTIENLGDVLGRRIVLGHRTGDIVFWADVEGGNPRAAGLAADIKKGMRAVSINASGAAAVSGMVNPNDHVDVIGTFAFPGEDGRKNQESLVTCTILQNVLVLATGKTTAKTVQGDGFGSSPGNYSTVTLEVSPREAEMLAFAEQIRGRLSLSLRNRSDVSYEKELPKVDFAKIREEIESLNLKRQQKVAR
jgi:pilus assembly protein CpaB